MKPHFSLPYFFCLIVGFLFRNAGLAATVVIDEFNITQGLSTTNFGYQSASVSYSSLDSPVDAIGGSRQAFVEILNTTSAPFDFVRAQVSGGILSFSSSPNTHGFLGLIYNHSETGLGLDLNQNFAEGDSIVVSFASVLTVPLSFTVSIHSNPSGAAVKTVSIPAGTNTFSLPLSELTASGDFNPANIFYFSPRFSEAQNGAGFQIDRIEIIPEPSVGSLVVVACGIFLRNGRHARMNWGHAHSRKLGANVTR